MRVLDKSFIYFAIPQATLPWQPILETKYAKLAEIPPFIALALRNGLEFKQAHSLGGRNRSNKHLPNPAMSAI